MPKTRILLVDDDYFVRTTLSEFLSTKGFQLISCAGADQALEVVKQPVDLAIIDILMPDMDGLELANRLRQMQPSLQIIMFTGVPTYAADVRATELGFEVVPKSNWYDLLIPTIERALAQTDLPRRRRPADLEQASVQYVAEGKWELAAVTLEEAAKNAESLQEWDRASAIYTKAADYYGKARGMSSIGRRRLEQLAEAARRVGNAG